ncbi:hypothetical protein HKX69_23770 [Streptomyces argyrophyllae]|uniref:Uncharacterized protein n=1 Tax=Streptomyces argyrophylli TaxID=2726118 RepID=A0A6M4PM85_9ACTN|nr:hypothetical protein [Streptomyces argyrophyllae]QJS12131.1 hypothetical protein HKX69_23770 [Streptomyces argyrophyllae]
MQMEEATRSQKAWEAKGSPPCEHPRKVKEYFAGSPTGDLICTTGGEDFPQS